MDPAEQRLEVDGDIRIDDSVFTSLYCRPSRIHYKQGGKELTWDACESFNSVSILCFHRSKNAFLAVKQFRPAVWASAERARIAELGLEGGASTSAAGGISWKEGLAVELAGGLVNKPGKTLMEHAAEELEEELGFKVAPDKLVPLFSFVESVGITGSSLHCFYAEVDDSNKVNGGGGRADENEAIVIEEIPAASVIAYLSRADLVKSAELMLALLLVAQPKPIRDAVFAKAALAFAPFEDRPFVVVSPPPASGAGGSKDPSPPPPAAVAAGAGAPAGLGALGKAAKRRPSVSSSGSENSSGAKNASAVGPTTDAAAVESFKRMLERNGLTIAKVSDLPLSLRLPSSGTSASASASAAGHEPSPSPPQMVSSRLLEKMSSGSSAESVESADLLSTMGVAAPSAAGADGSTTKPGFFSRVLGFLPFAPTRPAVTVAAPASSGIATAPANRGDASFSAAAAALPASEEQQHGGFAASPNERPLAEMAAALSRSGSLHASSTNGSLVMMTMSGVGKGGRGNGSLPSSMQSSVSSVGLGMKGSGFLAPGGALTAAEGGLLSRSSQMVTARGEEDEAPEGAVASLASSEPLVPSHEVALISAQDTPQGASCCRWSWLTAFMAQGNACCLGSLQQAAVALPSLLFYDALPVVTTVPASSSSSDSADDDDKREPIVDQPATTIVVYRFVFSPEKTFLVGLAAATLLGAGFFLGKKLSERRSGACTSSLESKAWSCCKTSKGTTATTVTTVATNSSAAAASAASVNVNVVEAVRNAVPSPPSLEKLDPPITMSTGNFWDRYERLKRFLTGAGGGSGGEGGK